jgi:hypothetical protein
MMDSVAARQIYLKVLPFFPVSVPPTHNITWGMDSGPIKPTKEV